MPTASDGNATDRRTSEAVRERVIALFEAHGAEFRQFVLGLLGSPEGAADVSQAVLTKALESGGSVRPETFKGWLFQVAYHEAMALKRRDRIGEKARRKLAAIAPADAPNDPVLSAEAVEAVRRALKGLPEEQRSVVMARVYEDKTFAEIAGEAGVPLGTVLSRMRRALHRLQDVLRPHDPEARS